MKLAASLIPTLFVWLVHSASAQSVASVDQPGDVPAGLSTSDWTSIRAAYEAGRHAAVPVDEGYRARNPGQRWRTVFDGRGFTTRPDAGGWSWGLELTRYGFADHEVVLTRPESVCAAGNRVAYAWDDALEEWYINDGRGLEHGYTIYQRPFQSEADVEHGPLQFILALRGDLAPSVEQDGRDVRFLDGAGETVLTYSGLTVFDADERPLPARFEEADGGLRLTVDESGARYPLTIDPTAHQTYLKASNAQEEDAFGASSISGDTIVIGAAGEDSFATGVNGNQTADFEENSGAAYVFVRNGTTWTQQAYLKASNTDEFDRFGSSVSVSGDTIVVGAHAEDSNATGIDGDQSDNSSESAGAAYVFVRNGTTWTQQAYLKASNTDPGDYFGSVRLSGDTVMVTAFRESSSATGVNGDQSNNDAPDAGAVYVFVRNGTTWSQQAYLKASNTESLDRFGGGSISGDTFVVGASGESSNATGVDGDQSDNSAPSSGATYIFVRNDTVWSQQAYLKASNTDPGDTFGGCSISGDTVVIGASREGSAASGVNGNQFNNNRLGSGAAYVFVRRGTEWSQQAYFKASNPGAGDGFGSGISISGNVIVVGAPRENSNATGINGDQSNNFTHEAGAAYVFVRKPGCTVWQQQAYLKATNTDAFDRLGGGPVQGTTVALVSINESSAATGVNGDQSDNSAGGSGAVYIYELQDFIDAPASLGTNYCFGVPNSTGLSASISAYGSLSLADEDVLLVASNLALGNGGGGTAALFFFGPNRLLGGVSLGNGVRCVGGMTTRIFPLAMGGMLPGCPGEATTAGRRVNFLAPYTGNIAPGELNFQCWYRDTPGGGFNATDGLSIVFVP